MDYNEKYMKRCLELAKQGLGNVAPNPMVGCVIVYDDRIIGEGYHIKCGEAHAEVNAINSVKDISLLTSSTLYVNLEPCSHTGKTPPCTDLIIKNNIPHVVTGSKDTNTDVAGRGADKLRAAGIDVTEGIMDKENRELNRRFFTYHEKERPYIILKWAQTIDGFIDAERSADESAEPLWITNDLCRTVVHKWRSEEQAIMVGTNTAEKDDPQLNVRNWSGNDPLRLVLDRTLRLPEGLKLFDKSIPTIVFTEKKKKNEENLEYIRVDFNKDVIKEVLDELYKRQQQSVIVEGGTILMQSFIDNGLWDEIRLFIGNRFFGKGVRAPEFSADLVSEDELDGSKLFVFRNNDRFIA